MRTVKLVIAFAGTHYSGWQSQRTGKTLQEVLEAQLARILKEKVNLHGSSRTDAGVHARGLVAHFKTKNPLPESKIQHALNFYLPRDIVVLSAKNVREDFHARFDAKCKTYEYRIWNHRIRPVYDLAPYVLWMPHRLNVAAMRQAAKYLLGKHDFNAFRDSGEEEKRTVRHLKRCHITREGHLVRLTFTADAFLKHMIRVLTGTLMAVGQGKLTKWDIITLLKSKDRKKAGPTVKAHGLTLLTVSY